MAVDVKGFFEGRLAKYGDSPKSLDWSEEGQRRRFEVLSEIGDVSGKSVLDLGCGLGHLYGFLKDRFGPLRYVGYDFSPASLATARAKYPEARFELHDVLREDLSGSFDFVLSCGIHNLETGTNEEDIHRLLRNAWRVARVGVGFSMLSSFADRKDAGRHYYDPKQIVSEALDLTRYVVLRQDYMPHDFSVFLYRGKQAPKDSPPAPKKIP